MNKKFIVRFVIVIIFSILLFSLTGCKSYIDEGVGLKLMQEAIEKSKGYDIFYWKEFNNVSEKVELTYVNVHCDANNEGLIYDSNGKYSNYATKIEKVVGKNKVSEQYCGESKSSKGKETLPFLIDLEYNSSGKHISSTKTPLSAFDYVASQEFEQYSIASKLYELSLLGQNDIDFSVKDGGIYKNGTVVVLKGKVKEEFLTKYLLDYGKESILKGEQLEVEMAYGRVSKVVVYALENLDSKFSNLKEIYKFELVYLGKNISVPSYDDDNMKYLN